MTLAVRPADVRSPSTDARPALGTRVTVAVDLLVLSGISLLATWTAAYWLALAGAIPSPVAFWGWLATAPLVVVVVVRRFGSALPPPGSPAVALLLAAAAAVAAVVVVRPDLDDASYVVRSTWIAAHGDVRVGDVIFSGGRWPGLDGQRPNVSSIEALVGWIARATGLSAGSVAYALLPPVAAVAAMWALHLMLRAWGARRESLCLAVAVLFLAMGGATAASWGNLSVARIWQGKVAFLAVVVPLLYALTARWWSAHEPGARRATLAATGLAAIAGVGLSPAAVFVAPGVVLVGCVPGLVRRAWRDVVPLAAVGVLPPLFVGVVVRAVGHVGEVGLLGVTAAAGPWHKVLGDGVPRLVVAVAVAVAVLGCVLPGRMSACDAVGRWTAAGAVLAGVLIAVPGVYDLAVRVMGTDAVAWRLTWIVPVPALVGLLAGLPARSGLRLGAPVAVATAAALVAGGLPVWSAANGAWLARPGAWKQSPTTLAAARWLAGAAGTGRVLAPVDVVAALGIVRADALPVGSRMDYLVTYAHQPGSRYDDRVVLQRLADGGTAPGDLAAAPGALAALDVRAACARSGSGVLDRQLAGWGYRPAFRDAGLVCFRAAG